MHKTYPHLFAKQVISIFIISAGMLTCSVLTYFYILGSCLGDAALDM